MVAATSKVIAFVSMQFVPPGPTAKAADRKQGIDQLLENCRFMLNLTRGVEDYRDA